MIGRFTTRKFHSRAHFEAREPFGVEVSYNRFTQVGLEWMWQMMEGQLRQQDGTLSDHLGNARLVVGNSSQDVAFSDTRLAGDLTAQADLDNGYPQIARDGESEMVGITFRSTFGEDQAIFEWLERGVVSAQGVLIDRSVADQGRKVLGAVWQLEAALLIGNPAT